MQVTLVKIWRSIIDCLFGQFVEPDFEWHETFALVPVKIGTDHGESVWIWLDWYRWKYQSLYPTEGRYPFCWERWPLEPSFTFEPEMCRDVLSLQGEYPDYTSK